MVIAESQITKSGYMTAEHIIFEGDTFIRLRFGTDHSILLDTDESLNLKKLLDLAMRDKSQSWQGGQ